MKKMINEDSMPDWFPGSKKEWLKFYNAQKVSFLQRLFVQNVTLKDSENIQRINQFSKCIKDGVLPDNQTLYWIAKCFEDYIDGKRSSLDRAFGLCAKTKSGNPAAQYKAEKYRNILLTRMAEIIVYSPDISKNEAAGMVLNEMNIDKPDEYSLARYFRKWPAREDTIKMYEYKKKRINKR